MNRLSRNLLVALALGGATAMAAPAPLTLTVKSYRALTNNLSRIIEAASPGSSGEALEGIGSGLGISQLKGIDLDRPWQVSIWAEGTPSRPDISVWIPTSDFAAFKEGLEDGALKAGETSIRNVGNYAGVWLAGSASAKDAEDAHAAWKPDQLKTVDKAILLEVVPGEPLRETLLQGLGGMRMMLSGVIAGQQAQAMPGLDPKALAELMGVYFDVIGVFLKGLERIDLSLDVRGENLFVSKHIRAKAGSELVGWLKAGEGSLDSVLPYVGSQAPVSFAMRWGESAGFMPTLKKFMRLSMQLQGVADDSEAVKETDKLMDMMFPLRAAGYVDMGKGFSVAGVYQFPGHDAGEVYKFMRGYFEKTMQSQSGEGKPYKSIRWEQAKQTVAGTKIDRATMEFNLDAPLYQMPGQKEMIEKLWPGGKMEFDYALKGENLFFASPANTENLLSGKAASSGVKPVVNKNTVGYARVNILKMLPMMLDANPMVPDEVKEKIKGLESAGTDVTMRIDLDGAASGEATVPLKLIQSLGKLQD